ncbi:MAG: hypothetical protein U5L96_15710 [Owenweeksia sp.]|nr:hypothetical protein [Owenweeksia sp.]
MLVGMAKNPALYNPMRDTALMKQRRNTVYAQMLRNEMITSEQFDTLKTRNLVSDFTRVGHFEGLAPCFREHMRAFMKNWVKKHAEAGGEDYNIYTDGLKIYTTIDSRMQGYAEQAVKAHFSNLQEAFFKRRGSQAGPLSPCNANRN